MNTKKNSGKSLIMITVSFLIFGTIGIFRRYVPLSSGILAFVRGIIGAVFLLAVVLIGKKDVFKELSLKKVIGLCISGCAMGFNWILLFEAYNYTNVSTATLCYYMEPVIVVLASALIFRERLTVKKWICSAVALLGMFFVSGIFENGTPEGSDLTGILLGLGAAALYSTVVLINKKLPGIDSYAKTIIQLSSAAIVLIPYLLITEDISAINLDSTALISIAVIGIVYTGVAYALYFGSMDGLRTQTIALFSYIDPILALILSAVILGETMTFLGIIGAILILGATIVSELELKTLKKHN